LADAQHLPHGRSRAGDRHLKFYETRDNLLESVGPPAVAASLLALLGGTVGLVVGRVRVRRTPAVDSPRALVARTAWTGWSLMAAAAAFAFVLAAQLAGLLVIEAEGGCGDASSWCGFGTAVLAYVAGVASTVLAAAGGALLWWSRRSATAGAGRIPSAAGRPTGVYGQS
jgi:hypothetical protein